IGEPERRDVTKIGGMPYRPASLGWPVSKEDGLPLTFVAQFRFAESADFMGELPGDMLLAFFADFAGAAYDYFPGPPHFEWHMLGCKELIAAEVIPKAGFVVPPCYGVRWRTVDFEA